MNFFRRQLQKNFSQKQKNKVTWWWGEFIMNLSYIQARYFLNILHIEYCRLWIILYLCCHNIFLVKTIFVRTSSYHICGYNYFRTYVTPPYVWHNVSTFCVTDEYICVWLFYPFFFLWLLNGIELVYIFNTLIGWGWYHM